MPDFHDLTLAVASRNLPEVFEPFQIRRRWPKLGEKMRALKPAVMSVDEFIQFLINPTPAHWVNQALPLRLADPAQDLASHLGFWPSILLFRASIDEIESQLEPERKHQMLLIPWRIADRIHHLIEVTNKSLRLTFCGQDLHRWHSRHRPDYTSPWSDHHAFGFTFWEYEPTESESPVMNYLRHIPKIREQEKATFMPC